VQGETPRPCEASEHVHGLVNVREHEVGKYLEFPLFILAAVFFISAVYTKIEGHVA
jgi:hypothetical protein